MKRLLLLLLLCLCGLAGGAGAGDWEEARRTMLERPRRVIYNNDGDDATWWPRNLPVTPENFLARRLRTMEGSRVDSMFYVVQISFTTTTYDSKVGRMLCRNTQTPAAFAANPELLRQGTDPFRLAVDYCRKNGKEIFASFRMNDIHDSWWAPGEKNRWVWLFPEFKRKHPELLFGTQRKRPPCGAWSAVDYEAPLVRETLLRLVEEVCENYQMDGLEFDFFRWPCLFKSVGWGKEATPEQRELLTNLFRDIRSVAERAGKKRGRPILIALRVPDSADYCRGIGIDLERWMELKLFDLMVAGGNMLLNPWENTAELCRKHGIKFYASLDMPRFDEPAGLLRRDVPEVWHARQAAALAAGADGLYYFNVFSPERVRNLMLGSEADVKYLDKRYFLTDMLIDTPNKYLRNGERFNNLPRLSCLEPVRLQPGKTRRFGFTFGDDLRQLAREGRTPMLSAMLCGEVAEQAELAVAVNGRELPLLGCGREFRCYAVPAEALRKGRNEVAFTAKPKQPEPMRKRLIASGGYLLKGARQAQWRRLWTAHDFPASEKIVDGAYLLTDSGSGEGEIANLLYPVYAESEEAVANFEAKLLAASDERSVVVRLADGRHVEIVSLMPGRIALLNGGVSAPLDTTGKFHAYELRMTADKVTLRVDGRELLAAPVRVKINTPEGDLSGYSYYLDKMNDSSFLFGSLSGPGTGAALWRNLCVTEPSGAAELREFVIDVRFPEAEEQAPEVAGWDRELRGESAVRLPFEPVPGLLPLVTGLAKFDARRGDFRLAVSDGHRFGAVRVTPDGVLSLADARRQELAVAVAEQDEFLLRLDGCRFRVYRNGVLVLNEAVSASASGRQPGGFAVEGPGAIEAKLKVDVPDPAPLKHLVETAAGLPVFAGFRAEAGMPGKPWRTTYDGRSARIEKRGSDSVLRLDHDNAKNQFQLFRGPLPKERGEVWGAEFRVRIAGSTPGKSVFNFALIPPGISRGTVPLVVKVFDTHFTVDGWGEFPLPPGDRHTFAVALDCRTRLGAVMVDGRLAAAGIPAADPDGKPSLWFGDGSAGTSGVAELEYLAVKAEKLDKQEGKH